MPLDDPYGHIGIQIGPKFSLSLGLSVGDDGGGHVAIGITISMGGSGDWYAEYTWWNFAISLVLIKIWLGGHIGYNKFKAEKGVRIVYRPFFKRSLLTLPKKE